MSNNQSDYDKYLASLHAKLQTPEEIIHQVVKEGTNIDFISKEKIIAGEANEVYDITLQNSNHVILRISENGYPNFLQEQWAIEQVRKIGVPVPEILLIKFITIDGKEKSFCLMEKVEGEPLERGDIDFNNLPEDIRKSYIVQAGEILSKIHSIKIHGYGSIIGEGKTEYNSSNEMIDQLLERKEKLNTLTRTKYFDPGIISQAFSIVDNFKNYYSVLPLYLNHGDYVHKHFMVKDTRITAILDWGLTRSDTPVADFVYFDYWYGDIIPTEWLKEGYQNKALFDDEFEKILHALRIIKGIEVISWYHLQNYQEAVEKAVKKLIADVEYFK